MADTTLICSCTSRMLVMTLEISTFCFRSCLMMSMMRYVYLCGGATGE